MYKLCLKLKHSVMVTVKDLVKRKLANNVLEVKASDVSNVASKDGYQHGFASIGYVFLTKRVEVLL